MKLTNTLRAVSLACIFLLIAVVLSSCGSGNGDSSTNAELTIGALVSLTGNGTTLGITSKSAMQIATDEINTATATGGSQSRLRVIYEDTSQDPATALTKLQQLYNQGVRIVIGPQTSSELAAIRDFADTHGMLIISHGSTSSSLAIPGDNVFRFVPDDTKEAEAVAALMSADGITTIVPAWRTDLGNTGLKDAVSTAFRARGGTVTTGVSYTPETTDFTSFVIAIRSQVEAAQATAGTNKVAVYLAAFDKVVDIFNLAITDPVLINVKWYGSDGVAKSATLLNDATAASFASNSTVDYPNPTFGLAEADRPLWEPLSEKIKNMTGLDPDSFALAAYDALRVAVQAEQDAGGTSDINALKAAFVTDANNYHGVTGSTALNAAGDRQSSNFDFWAIRSVNGTFQWTRVAQYINGNITR